MMAMQDTLTVLMLTTHFPPKRGGVETSCVQYLDAAEQEECPRFSVITYENRLDHPFDDEWTRSTVHRISIPERQLRYMSDLDNIARIDVASPLKKVSYMAQHFLAMWKGIIRHRAAVRSADVIMANGAFAEGAPACLASIVFRKPLVLRWRTDVKGFLVDGPVRLATRLMFRRSTRILVNGADMKDQISDHFGVAEDRISVMRNAVDLQRCQILDPDRAAAARGLVRDKFTVLFASGFDETASGDYLADLAAYVLERDLSYRFVFIGGGPRRKQIEALGVRYPDNIVLIDGFVEQPQLIEYINASSAVAGKADSCYPSRLVLESLACGIPVIVPGRPTSSVTGRSDALDIKIDVPDRHVTVLHADPLKGGETLMARRADLEALLTDEARSEARAFIEERHGLQRVMDHEFAELRRAANRA